MEGTFEVKTPKDGYSSDIRTASTVQTIESITTKFVASQTKKKSTTTSNHSSTIITKTDHAIPPAHIKIRDSIPQYLNDHIDPTALELAMLDAQGIDATNVAEAVVKIAHVLLTAKQDR